MYDDIVKLIDKAVAKVKKPLYGKTFYCPVCHLELSYHDLDENGCVVCPVCGVVMEVHSAYGHNVPVVHDVEINRYQPKLRIHPLATHLPIGLFPLAMVGALFLSVASAYFSIDADSRVCSWCASYLGPISNAVYLLFGIAVAGSLLTYLSGLWDWRYRYGKRPYRVITLKIIFSAVFLVAGAAVVGLHAAIFPANGIADLSQPAVLAALIAYLVAQGVAFVAMATLGHVGGYLVYGK